MLLEEFHALRTGKIEGWEYSYSVMDLGEVYVPSGKLEASDPYVSLGNSITVPIPPGRYPVKVTLVDLSLEDEEDGSHLRPVYLSTTIAEGTPARVYPFVPEGAEPLEPDQYYGVGVDAGTVAFADKEAAQSSASWEAEHGNDYIDEWIMLLSSNRSQGEAVNTEMPWAKNGENIVFCLSGWGDGFYPVVLTENADGNLLGVHIHLFMDERIDSDLPDIAQQEPKAEVPVKSPETGNNAGTPKRLVFQRLLDSIKGDGPDA